MSYLALSSKNLGKSHVSHRYYSAAAFVLAFVFLSSAGWTADVDLVPAPKITAENLNYRISSPGKPGYDALIAPDGAMMSLRFPKIGETLAHQSNFIRVGVGAPKDSGIGGSRGTFFYQQDYLPLETVKQTGDTSITASGKDATIVYQFLPGSIKCTLTNVSSQTMQFFMLLDSSVRVVGNGAGVLLPSPAVQLWPDIVCYQDSLQYVVKTTISGADRIWGPAAMTGKPPNQDGTFQVVETDLKPKETRVLTITPGDCPPEEVAQVSAVVPTARPTGSKPAALFVNPKPAAEGPLAVLSPSDYQVFQRQTMSAGKILLSGTVQPACDQVQARLTGTGLNGALPGTWEDVPFDKACHSFRAELPTQAGGWYQLEVRALLAGKEVASNRISHVGVGEVFVTCGQSNSTNCGSEPTRSESGMVSTFGGDIWKLSEDPQPGVHDAYKGGSPWPAFGDALYAKCHVPVAIAVTGNGGAPARHWTAGGEPFIWTLMRINQLGFGGFRALLWHQGESDATGTTEQYYTTLSNEIRQFRAAAGWDFPWFVAQVSCTGPGKDAVLHSSTRDAQKRIWDEGIALEGPDTDTLTGDLRAGVHFNPKGLKAHGDMWADKVGAYLDQVSAQEPH
ncbi:MAG: sialate O-acetylesterase [Terrimicrobiaceae bacterium]